MKEQIIATQIRIPENMHKYLKSESERLGIPQNSVVLILLDMGRKINEATISLYPQTPK